MSRERSNSPGTYPVRAADAGVGDDQPDVAQLGEEGADDVAHRVQLGDVDRTGDDAPARVTARDLGGELGQEWLAACREAEVVAPACQLEGEGPADSGRRSGDDGGGHAPVDTPPAAQCARRGSGRGGGWTGCAPLGGARPGHR